MCGSGPVAVIFVWQDALSQNQKLQVLGLGMLAVFGIAAALEYFIKQKKVALHNYLARRDPAEFTPDDLSVLFRAFGMRAESYHLLEHDLYIVRYLRYYVEHHASGALTGPAKDLAEWMWLFRRHFQHWDPRIDLSWLGPAVGRLPDGRKVP